MYKKAIDISGLGDVSLRRIEEASDLSISDATGVAGDHIAEPGAAFIRTPSEKVIQNKNGAYIVLGRDRPGNRLSGYGGKGDTQASSIDIVVGRMGSKVASVNEYGDRVYTDPSFDKDAARIYVSQKADIDDYFQLSKGKVGISKTKSAVALKADSVRLVSRQGIKLVTGVGDENSQGGKILQKYGIDLIANNDDSDMQPLVKGDNLEACLIALIDHVDSLNGIVESLARNQMLINSALLKHTHTVVSLGAPTLPSVDLLPEGVTGVVGISNETYTSLVNHKINSSMIKYNYCKPIGGKYINSKYNNTN